MWDSVGEGKAVRRFHFSHSLALSLFARDLFGFLSSLPLNGLPENGVWELGSGEEEERGIEDEAGGKRVVPRELDRSRRKMIGLCRR